MRRKVSYIFILFSFLHLYSCGDPGVPPSGNGDPSLLDSYCNSMNCNGMCCGNLCVDVQSNSFNCGVCGNRCAIGSVCAGGECTSSCDGKYTQCGSECVDIFENSSHCGMCGHMCGSNMECSGARCVCREGYVDCDHQDWNGCESLVSNCECSPGTQVECYYFSASTRGIGRCRAGILTCDGSGSYSGECIGLVGPTTEIPSNSIDDDCDGVVDEADMDGDGWTAANGDCCEGSLYDSCQVSSPELVNPGAVEVLGDGIDNDCDGKIDNVLTCSSEASSLGYGAEISEVFTKSLLESMELCKFTTLNSNTWGVVHAKLTLADGSPLPRVVEKCPKYATGNETTGSPCKVSPSEQVAVTKKFGGLISPQVGETMLVLSSGKAQGADQNLSLNDEIGTRVLGPSEFLAAHGGEFPSHTACPTSGNEASDSIKLSIQMRVPSNANGFKFRFKFFSKEYPEYACAQYNDAFLVLLTSQHKDTPLDHNISFDAKGNPVSVNNAFFTACQSQTCDRSNFHAKQVTFGSDNCPASLPCQNHLCGGPYSCSEGSADVLAYTTSLDKSGATSWLFTEAPVMPNELITLDFHIFDAGGYIRDSLVLVDGFEWKTEKTQLSTDIILN